MWDHPFKKFELLWQFLVYLEKFPYLALTRVNDFMIAGSIIFKHFEEIPSNPQLCFVGKLCIIIFTACSSTLFILKVECIYLFR